MSGPRAVDVVVGLISDASGRWLVVGVLLLRRLPVLLLLRAPLRLGGHHVEGRDGEERAPGAEGADRMSNSYERDLR